MTTSGATEFRGAIYFETASERWARNGVAGVYECSGTNMKANLDQIFGLQRRLIRVQRPLHWAHVTSDTRLLHPSWLPDALG